MRELAFRRAAELYQRDRTIVVIESIREPDKFFIENNSPMVRCSFERIIWENGHEVK